MAYHLEQDIGNRYTWSYLSNNFFVDFLLTISTTYRQKFIPQWFFDVLDWRELTELVYCVLLETNLQHEAVVQSVKLNLNYYYSKFLDI